MSFSERWQMSMREAHGGNIPEEIRNADEFDKLLLALGAVLGAAVALEEVGEKMISVKDHGERVRLFNEMMAELRNMTIDQAVFLNLAEIDFADNQKMQ